MNAKPPFSIVIPSLLRTDLLRLCLQSVKDHAPDGTQVIVIDDGSKKGDVSQIARSMMPCEIIRHDKPQGFCIAANAGLKAARAEIVQMLNDDAELASGVTSAIEAFANPNVGAVAAMVLRWPGQTIDSAGDCYDVGGFAQPRGRGHRPIGQWLCPRDVDAASGCAAFYRRELILELGGFAESFGSFFEDVDLSLRLRRRGYSIRYVPDCRVLHRGSSSHRQCRSLIARQSRNEERVFWRNTGGTPTELVRHAVVLALKAFRRLTEGAFWPWSTGRFAAWVAESQSPADSISMERHR
jgi:GT2 family glycosyltransferase